MRFSDEELEAAKRLRSLGLPWQPQVGHFVYDQTDSCQRESPFQDRVYFILNYSHFMKLVQGEERFRELMLWLPTWEDLREILRTLNVSQVRVANHLDETNAIENGTERLALYELVQSLLLERSPRLPMTHNHGPAR